MKTESEKQENKELEKISHQKIGNLKYKLTPSEFKLSVKEQR